MKVIGDSNFTLEQALDYGDQIESVVNLEDAKKVDVLIALAGIFHGSIVSWTTRVFEAITWAVGIEFAVVSFVFVNADKVTRLASIVVATGLFIFGVMTQLYLRAASRAHSGNRLGIAKCEAALGLYQPGKYLEHRSFFIYSKAMLVSRNLSVLSRFHAVATVVSIVSVLVGGAVA
jgi:hypothetical protein